MTDSFWTTEATASTRRWIRFALAVLGSWIVGWVTSATSAETMLMFLCLRIWMDMP